MLGQPSSSSSSSRPSAQAASSGSQPVAAKERPARKAKSAATPTTTVVTPVSPIPVKKAVATPAPRKDDRDPFRPPGMPPMMPFDPQDIVKTQRAGVPLTSSSSESDSEETGAPSKRTRTPTPPVEPTEEPVPRSEQSIAIDRAETVYKKITAIRAEPEQDRGRSPVRGSKCCRRKRSRSRNKRPPEEEDPELYGLKPTGKGEAKKKPKAERKKAAKSPATWEEPEGRVRLKSVTTVRDG